MARQILKTLVMSLLVLAAADGAANEVAASTIKLDIASQPLGEALSQFAQQSGLQVVFFSEVSRGIQAPSVVGSFSASDALAKLLAGTGLGWRFVDERTVGIGSEAETGGKIKSTAGMETAGAFRVAQADAPTEGERQAAPKIEEEKKEGVQLEEIVVTGTHIRGAPAGARASPLTVFDRVEIERLGITTAGEILKVLPQNQGSPNSSPYANLGAARYANLRGLGDGTTLVLINGQRPPTSATSVAISVAPAQFNLDVIPAAAIERIEILTDGASAIYGSDAIGGVINVILRRNYDGLEVSTKYSSASDLAENSYTAVGGGHWGRLSAVVGGEYYDRDGLVGGDRVYSARLDKTSFGGTNWFDPLSAAPIPAVVSAFPGTGNLPGLSSDFAAAPGGTPRPLQVSDFSATQGQQNPLVDFTHFSTIVQPEERSSGFGHFSLALNDDWTANLGALYAKTKSNNDTISPFSNDPLFPFYVFGAANPYNPFGVDTLVSFYLPDLPVSHSVVDTEDYGLSSGLNGRLAGDWEIHAAIDYGASRSHQVDTGADPFKVVIALLESDPALALNPLFGGQDASPSLLRSLISLRQDGLVKTQARGVSIGATGSLVELPAGNINVALGAEARKDDFDFSFLAAFTGATAPIVVDQSRDVKSAFVELSIPVFRDESFSNIRGLLDLSLAARYEDYSDFGNTTNPKVGVRWKPTRHLTARSTWGTAFQAPSLSQQYFPATVLPGFFFGPIFDPVLNQTYTFQQFIVGGNSALQPQEADTLSAGLEYENTFGVATWSASVDAYRIDFEDRIRAPVDVTELIGLEPFFPQLIVRDPITQQISDIVSAPINLATVKTSGVDLSFSYRRPAFNGEFGATLAGTIVTKYDVQTSPVAPVLDRLSFYGFSNRFKANLQLQYSRASWEGAAVVYHADDYRSDQLPGNVRSHTTMDLQLSYRCCASASFLKNAKLMAGVINVFDREPPFYNGISGFDIGEGDPLQRRVYGKLSVEF